MTSFRPLIISLCCLSFTIFANTNEVVTKSHLIPIIKWSDSTTNTPVWLVQRHENPILDISVIYRAGSAFDKNANGLAAITSEMIPKGVYGMSFKKLRRSLAEVGAIINSDYDVDKASLSLRSLTKARNFNQAWPLFLKVVKTPSLQTKELSLVKKSFTAQLLQKINKPMYIASKKLLMSLYPNHPYGQYPTSKTINKINKRQVTNFFKKYYVRENAAIILVGDISLAAAKKLATKLAQTLPKGKKAPTTKQPEPQTNKTMEIGFKSQQSAIILGQLAISRKNKDLALLNLASHILGGGMSSILFKEIRDNRGWCYYIFSTFRPYSQTGPFFIGTKTQQHDLQKVIAKITQTTNDFAATGPTKEQLKTAKLQIISSIYSSIASNEGLLSILKDLAFYEMPIDHIDRYIQQLNTATTDRVKTIFAQILKPMTIITVGPSSNKKQPTNV